MGYKKIGRPVRRRKAKPKKNKKVQDSNLKSERKRKKYPGGRHE